MAGGGGKAAKGRSLARITNKCWGHKHAGSASQYSPRICAAKLGRYRSSMNFRFLIYVLAVFSTYSYAFQPSLVHQHYTVWEGVLPEPYKTIYCEIRLNEETDDVETLNIVIGGTKIEFNSEDLAKLKNVELGTLQFLQEMYRSEDKPAAPLMAGFKDWLYLKVEVGPKYRVDWEEGGKTQYHWGKDIATIMITMGSHGSIHIDKLQPPM